MFVLGTAGHIDHGKSVLIRALTGIEPDRLREEKERGMTIDLGFAWMKLPGGGEVGIVDVPGHERLIRNMLAGVGGIDLALLVVDAREGVMPQTREHLAILDIMGIAKGVVVLTKKDLVDDVRLDILSEEVKAIIAPTSLAGSPVVAVSALGGEGLPELVSTIEMLLGTVPPRSDSGFPRLPVDRAFILPGSGTVVTGTLLDGSLATGREVEIVPSGLRSRIRGMQTHRSSIGTATPGTRVGVNLAGISPEDVYRGNVLTVPGWLSATTMISVRLSLLEQALRPLSHNTTVNFYTGSARATAKVRILEKDDIKPGEDVWAQLLLSKPLAVVKGDRFIIRSPQATLGGGEIMEVHTRRYRRRQPDIIRNLEQKGYGTAEELVLAALEKHGSMDLTALSRESSINVTGLVPIVENLIEKGKLSGIGAGKKKMLFSLAGWARIEGWVTALLEEYHRKLPVRPGMPRAELGSRLRMGAHNSLVVGKLIDSGAIVEEGGFIRLPGHRVRLTGEQQIKVDRFIGALEENPFAPPGDAIPEMDLLNLLVARKQVMRVSEGVVFSLQAYNEMVARITSYLQSKGSITVAEVRDLFQTSRKYAIALLEYMDGARITRRIGDRRVLYRDASSEG
ncbi:MAG: selenocysteine-specific translation elongation factor [Dehalococcoidales bacterium]